MSPGCAYCFAFFKRIHCEVKPMSDEQLRWLLKVIQPERTLACLPEGASLAILKK